jgi:hypothetical protein
MFVALSEVENCRNVFIEKDYKLSDSRNTGVVAIRFEYVEVYLFFEFMYFVKLIFSYYNTSICCLSCVLSSGAQNLYERIMNIRHILEKTRFSEVPHSPTVNSHDYKVCRFDFKKCESFSCLDLAWRLVFPP